MKFLINELNNIPHNLSGIYLIYNKNNKIIYIGSSWHLHTRLTNHIRMNEFKWHGAIYVWLIISPFEFYRHDVRNDRLKLEKIYIKYYKPILNKYCK